MQSLFKDWEVNKGYRAVDPWIEFQRGIRFFRVLLFSLVFVFYEGLWSPLGFYLQTIELMLFQVPLINNNKPDTLFPSLICSSNYLGYVQEPTWHKTWHNYNRFHIGTYNVDIYLNWAWSWNNKIYNYNTMMQ